MISCLRLLFIDICIDIYPILLAVCIRAIHVAISGKHKYGYPLCLLYMEFIFSLWLDSWCSNGCDEKKIVLVNFRERSYNNLYLYPHSYEQKVPIGLISRTADITMTITVVSSHFRITLSIHLILQDCHSMNWYH